MMLILELHIKYPSKNNFSEEASIWLTVPGGTVHHVRESMKAGSRKQEVPGDTVCTARKQRVSLLVSALFVLLM